MELEDKPDLLVPESGKFFVPQREDVHPVIRTLSRRRLVQRPDDVQQRALPRPGRSDDGDDLPLRAPRG